MAITFIANHMTAAIDPLISASAMIGTDAETRSREQDNARKELDAMSAAMIEEEGLLNHAQAAAPSWSQREASF